MSNCSQADFLQNEFPNVIWENIPGWIPRTASAQPPLTWLQDYYLSHGGTTGFYGFNCYTDLWFAWGLMPPTIYELGTGYLNPGFTEGELNQWSQNQQMGINPFFGINAGINLPSWLSDLFSNLLFWVLLIGGIIIYNKTK
jgi:hypothetical protein